MEKKDYYHINDKTIIVDDPSRGHTNYVLKFCLTNFFGSTIIEHEDGDGDMCKGVFIPIDKNDLRLGMKNTVNAYCFVNKTMIAGKKYDWWSHYLKLKVSKNFANKLKSLGINIPWGNCFPFRHFYLCKIVVRHINHFSIPFHSSFAFGQYLHTIEHISCMYLKSVHNKPHVISPLRYEYKCPT